MINRTISCASIALFLILSWTQTYAEEPKYLQLVDKLDRPNDGYCFDVQGVRGSFRADKPLVAHNCKPGAAPDGLVEHNADNMLFFTAFDRCVTAMGTGSTLLPRTSLMLKLCEEKGVFASPPMHKKFTFKKNKQLELGGSNLCVVVGDKSARTLSSRDRWRAMYLDDCDKSPLERSQWQLVSP